MNTTFLTVLIVAVSWAALAAVSRVAMPTGKAILVRIAHLGLMTAGLLIAVYGLRSPSRLPWLLVEAGPRIVLAAVGTALLMTWATGLLPTALTKADPPDWLAFAGLVIPSTLLILPGPAGDLIRTAIRWAGTGIHDGLLTAIGLT
ncbi:MAG: hypothetical protein ACRCZP_11545 [Phycicoccus sp.]